MKKGWKIGLAVAAVAGLIPFRHKKDEETGASVMQALLWSYAKKPGGDTLINIGLHLGAVPLPTDSDENTETCAGDETAETADSAEEAAVGTEALPDETAGTSVEEF